MTTIPEGHPLTWTMVRYRVKPDQAAINEALIRAVFDELARTEPAGLRYAAFKLDDGVTFVHLAGVDADAGPNPLTQQPAFQAFLSDHAARCDEPPVAGKAENIGAFRF